MNNFYLFNNVRVNISINKEVIALIIILILFA